MMKKYVLSLLLVSIVFASCDEDFLDTPSLTQISAGNGFSSADDAYLAINGVYSSLQSRSLYGGSLNGWQGYPGFDGIGDKAFNQFKWEGPGIFMEGNLNPASGPVMVIGLIYIEVLQEQI